MISGNRSVPPSASITACSISYIKVTTTTADGSKLLLFNRWFGSTVPTYILRDVSFTANPGQVLAIVGPSGAGKSTLLDILAARLLPTKGTLLLNSSPLDPSTYRRISAHVPQHDHALPLLTVRETFAFTAHLLLHDSSLASEAVTALLSDLNLTHIANSRLSHHLSGGERRRISIGLSLLHDPAVLLLDEPTSGLDSCSAFNVMQTLKNIATTRDTTVIVSIHQPSFKILDTIDSILLLSKGTLIHHGTISSLQSFLESRSFHVPPQINSLEYAMEIITQLHSTGDVVETTMIGDEELNDNNNKNKNKKQQPQYRCSQAKEIVTLYMRFCKIIYRTRQLLMTNALEAVGVGLLLATLYTHLGLDKKGVEKRLGLFAFTLTFLLSSTTEALPIFVNERPVLLRETSSGVYRLSSHLIANTLVFLPYLLVLSVVYSSAVYFIVGLCNSWEAFGFFVLVTWVVVLMANSFTLFLSCLAPNYIAGTSLLTMSLAGFFLFSGYFIGKENMPKYWVFMHYLSLYKYALDALIENEYGCSRSKCFEWDGDYCSMTGMDYLVSKNLGDGSQRWSNVQIMVGYFVLYRILYWVVLARRISISNK
ncbi:ABC transporter G family member [Zostera marina]|uniref:ABC transporter G family member n=1 Tax=Zostera marina TaxID=29655 RepID=A0A0K9PPQ0_ZOSMR|nr:ABC transporter G family member [Zostera marina]